MQFQVRETTARFISSAGGGASNCRCTCLMKSAAPMAT